MIYSAEAYEILQADDNLIIEQYSCTSNCELCAQTLFCLVEGEIITGLSPEELVKNVYDAIENDDLFN